MARAMTMEIRIDANARRISWAIDVKEVKRRSPALPE